MISKRSACRLPSATKALGVSFPLTFLGRADDVIECGAFAAVHESACVEGFGCRPATSARHTPVAGVGKPPRKEPAGDGARRMPRTPLWGFGWRGGCERGSAVSFEAVGRQR